MPQSTLQAKSIKGDGKAYLWVILDHDGKMDAVAHGAKSVGELLSKGGLSLALIKSKKAFENKGINAVASTLINPATGSTF
jgi:hypothetical protein